MMHYFKRNIGDYHKKAGRLSILEHGAYTLLLDACYDRERFPTMEEAIDWCWARSAEEIAAVTFVLSKFFDLVDGKYVQARIRDEIASYHSMALKNKEIAEKREEAKRTKRASNSTNRAPVVYEPAPNQEPLTNNQEPEDQHNTLSASDENSSEPVDPKSPCEMTLEWQPDARLLAAFAKRMGLAVSLFTHEAIGAFVCHYAASGRFETQQAWVSLLVKWIKRDKATGASGANIHPFPVRKTSEPDFDDTSWADGLVVKT